MYWSFLVNIYDVVAGVSPATRPPLGTFQQEKHRSCAPSARRDSLGEFQLLTMFETVQHRFNRPDVPCVLFSDLPSRNQTWQLKAPPSIDICSIKSIRKGSPSNVWFLEGTISCLTQPEHIDGSFIHTTFFLYIAKVDASISIVCFYCVVVWVRDPTFQHCVFYSDTTLVLYLDSSHQP